MNELYKTQSKIYRSPPLDRKLEENGLTFAGISAAVCPGAAWTQAFEKKETPDRRRLGITLCVVSAFLMLTTMVVMTINLISW